MNFFHLCPLYSVFEGIQGQVTTKRHRSCRNPATFAAVEQQKRIRMDIVVLEKKAFEQLIDETRRLTQRVESLSQKCQDKRLQKWLTGEDVCAILKISSRSLQTMRSKHKICYAQLGRKFYYRPEEVELVIRQSGKYHSI